MKISKTRTAFKKRIDGSPPQRRTPVKPGTKKSHLKALERHYLKISADTRARSELMIDLLEKPPNERNLDDVMLIREELKEMKYFKKLPLGDDFLIFCQRIRLQELKEKEVLFKKVPKIRIIFK